MSKHKTQIDEGQIKIALGVVRNEEGLDSQ